MVGSCGGDAKAAAALLTIEKPDEMVKRQMEAISNLRMDKITLQYGHEGPMGFGGPVLRGSCCSSQRALDSSHSVPIV